MDACIDHIYRINEGTVRRSNEELRVTTEGCGPVNKTVNVVNCIKRQKQTSDAQIYYNLAAAAIMEQLKTCTKMSCTKTKFDITKLTCRLGSPRWTLAYYTHLLNQERSQQIRPRSKDVQQPKT